MNGPQHYAFAEKLLQGAGDINADGEFLVALAQVHATLALAAATIEPAGWQPGEHPGWREALR